MKRLIPFLALTTLALSPVATAQRGGAPRALPEHEQPETAGVAWFGTWDAALAEAKRTNRPILFMSAAPQCQGVPGVW